MTAIGLISSWAEGGIGEYAKQLARALQFPHEIVSIPHGGLDRGGVASTPAQYFASDTTEPLIILNHHEAVTPGWSGVALQSLRHDHGKKSIVILHNTFGEHSPDEMRANGDPRLNLAEDLYQAADLAIVHEPCLGFPNAVVIRQGIPKPQPLERTQARSWPGQPVLGTNGYPFPWKNYDRLAEITAAAGWGILLLAPGATDEQVREWTRLNPASQIETDYLSTARGIALLSDCDATAYCYTGAFAGTSGAIRWGIAARKPVIAFRGQRQFRDLETIDRWPTLPWLPESGRQTIRWIDSWEDLPRMLRYLPMGRVDPAIVHLAQRDSWTAVGETVAAIIRGLLA